MDCSDGEVGSFEAEEGNGNFSEIIPHYRASIGYFMRIKTLDFAPFHLTPFPRDVANPSQNPFNLNAWHFDSKFNCDSS